jgi:hypothetical protein
VGGRLTIATRAFCRVQGAEKNLRGELAQAHPSRSQRLLPRLGPRSARLGATPVAASAHGQSNPGDLSHSVEPNAIDLKAMIRVTLRGARKKLHELMLQRSVDNIGD